MGVKICPKSMSLITKATFFYHINKIVPQELNIINSNIHTKKNCPPAGEQNTTVFFGYSVASKSNHHPVLLIIFCSAGALK